MDAAETLTDLPTPKFRIGDRVFLPSTSSEAAQLPCPECLGSQKWKVITPAGSELGTKCVRCGGFMGLRDVPSLTYVRYVAVVTPITIAFVKASSAPGWGDRDQVEYMTSTTGSGSIYYEGRLFATEAEARAVAEAEAAAKNAAEQAKPERLAQREFSNLTCESATMVAARDAISGSWWAYRHLHDAVAELVSEEEPPTVLADLLYDLRWRLEFEKGRRTGLPLGDLMDALKAGDLPGAQKVAAQFEALLATASADHAAANPDAL